MCVEWNPKKITNIIKLGRTSMSPLEIETEQGRGYIKVMGGCNAGPHPLACEWVGSQLARRFGLPIPDFCIMEIDCFDSELIRNEGVKDAMAGPAFCSKTIPEVFTWNTKEKRELIRDLENIDFVSMAVVFDTWTLNWDRYPPQNSRKKPNYDNLLFASSKTKNKFRIFFIDFGECFSKARELNGKISHIDRVQSKEAYGIFPAFRNHITRENIAIAVEKMTKISEKEIEDMVQSIPKKWDVDSSSRLALTHLITRRSSFLSSNIYDILSI